MWISLSLYRVSQAAPLLIAPRLAMCKPQNILNRRVTFLLQTYDNAVNAGARKSRYCLLLLVVADCSIGWILMENGLERVVRCYLIDRKTKDVWDKTV